MKKRAIKIIIAFVLFVIAIIIPFKSNWINVCLYILSYILVGAEMVKKAVRNIFRGEIFDENFLMTIATLGAFCIGELPEAVAVMLFYQVGELFQSYAVNKSRKSIADLMNIRPDYANLLINDEIKRVDPNEVKVGDIIIVKPGEKVPLDGNIIEGNSMLDTMALTGEAVPKECGIGQGVLSGYVNINGLLKIEVTKEFGESTVNKILELVENATTKKSKSENFITKFAKYYTPIVVIIAVFLAILPPIFIEGFTFNESLYRALAFLVVSCPCALVISIPLSFFGGIGGASKMGILIKGSNYLEALSNTEIVAFDKTGTLTEGVFEVQKIEAIEISEDELIKIAVYAENYSTHPISNSIKSLYSEIIDEKLITDVQELSGRGIIAKVEGREVVVGNEKLMQEKNIYFTKCKEIGTILYVAIENKYVGYILISDKIKADSQKAINDLKQSKIKQIIMLTGDNEDVGKDVAKKLGIEQVYTKLLPGDKVAKVQELLNTKTEKGKLAFIGDGINDAPVLALADVGIAMGGVGSDAAIEASDIVIMTDEPSKLSSAIKLSKKTMRIVKQNIVFAISVKAIVLLLSSIGLATMWEAVFADVGVSIISILNALRMLKNPLYE